MTLRENVTNRAVMAKYFDGFRRRMSKASKFHYVAILEHHKVNRDSFHIHVAVRGRQCYQLVHSIWQSIVGKDAQGRQMAQVNVRDPHKFGFGKEGRHKLAAYIAKNLSQ